MTIDAVRVHVRLSNNALAQRREDAGLTRAQLAEMAGCGESAVREYERIRRPPRDRFGNWKHQASAIAEALGVLPEDLWPPVVEAIRCPVATRTLSADQLELYAAQEAERLMLPSTDDVVDRNRLVEQVAGMVEVLPAREKMVIKLRFGFDGETEHTLEEIGKKLRLQRERVRMIEAKAIRKMQHPRRNAVVKAFLK